MGKKKAKPMTKTQYDAIMRLVENPIDCDSDVRRTAESLDDGDIGELVYDLLRAAHDLEDAQFDLEAEIMNIDRDELPE